jgi:hypothetical protein
MKTRKIFFTLTLLSLSAIDIFSQETSTPKTISDILSNKTEASEKIQFIFTVDVFKYFALYDFDTELKREIYKKTTEYLNYLNELKNGI